VFATGSMDWLRALRGLDPKHGIDAATVAFAQKVTRNLVTAMATGPLAGRHPSTPDLASVGDSGSTSTGTGGRVGQ
jgi:hypothetical protein